MSRILATLALSAALAGGLVAPAFAQGQSPAAPGHNKVPICHLEPAHTEPDGTLVPAQYVLKLVPPPAVPGHLRHGDVLPVGGVCPPLGPPAV